METLWTGLLMGVCGTLAMDIWAQVLHRAAGQPLPNWAMVGRWAGHLPGGRIFHSDMAQLDPVTAETALGWAVQYGVGLAYGVIFVALAGPDWLAQPSFVPLWIFSLLTIAAGWFLLQPGMGLGWAAARTARPWKVRGMGLVAHTVFGLGMWIGAVVA